MNTPESAIKDISKTAGLLCQKGWAESNAGNISVRLQHGSGLPHAVKTGSGLLRGTFQALSGAIFIITGSGRRMRDVLSAPLDNLIALQVGRADENHDKNGVTPCEWFCLGNDKNITPTSELASHLLVHETGHINVVVHGRPARTV